MTQICLHCPEEKLEEQKYQLILGDITCCGDKNDSKKKICRQEGHKVYICRGNHGAIGDLIFRHNV